MPPLGLVTIDQRGRELWLVTVLGEYDLSNAAELRGVLESCAEGSVVVDLSQATFIDSTVLHILIAARESVCEGHGFAVVAPLESFPSRVLTIGGLGGPLNVCDSTRAAFEIVDAIVLSHRATPDVEAASS